MQPSDQELLSYIKSDDQNHWAFEHFGQYDPHDFYLILCNYTTEQVAEVTDQQLAGVVEQVYNHMISLQKTRLVFENAGNGFHYHTLVFVDKIVKLLQQNHSISIENCYFLVGILAHEKNIGIYEKICADYNFSRLNLIFTSSWEGQLNGQIQSTPSYQHPEVNVTAKVKNKKFTAINCNMLKDSLNNFQGLASELTYVQVNDLSVSDQTKDVYDQSYFTLTVEDIVYKNQEASGQLTSWKVGASTFNPMAFRHAFLLLARPGALSILKDMGYKTFSPYIDESYDQLLDDAARFNAVVDEAHRLCELTDQEWIDFQNNVQEIVNHNFNKLVSRPHAIVFETEVNRLYTSQ